MSGLHLTLATAADRANLAAFSCGVGQPHLIEVNEYIRTRALDEFITGVRSDHGYRLLLAREAGDLVGVAAHERNWRVTQGGIPLPGSEIVVFALASAHQGRRLPSKQSLFRATLEIVLDDVAASREGEWLTMVVRATNDRMMSICRNLPNVVEGRMRSGDPFFVARL